MRVLEVERDTHEMRVLRGRFGGWNAGDGVPYGEMVAGDS